MSTSQSCLYQGPISHPTYPYVATLTLTSHRLTLKSPHTNYSWKTSAVPIATNTTANIPPIACPFVLVYDEALDIEDVLKIDL